MTHTFIGAARAVTLFIRVSINKRPDAAGVSKDACFHRLRTLRPLTARPDQAWASEGALLLVAPEASHVRTVQTIRFTSCPRILDPCAHIGKGHPV